MEKMSKNTRKIDILFAIPSLEGGGAERVFVNIIRSLDSKKFNKKLVVIDGSGVFMNLLQPDVQIFVLNSDRTRYSFYYLLNIIKESKPQIIVSTLNRMNILILLVSFFINRKIKIIIREPNMPKAQFESNYLPRYYLWLMKLLYPRADMIIAQTDAMKEEIRVFFKINPSKISVLTNPIDKNFIDEKVRDGGSPFRGDDINIVASGRITKQKGFDYLIKSFAKVVTINNKFKLFLLGVEEDDGSYKKGLIKLIQQLNLNNHIIFMGFQENPFIYYKYADLFVLSSRWEGLPNVILEVLYLKTPVIVTDSIPFFRDIIFEGENGYIVNFNDEETMVKGILNYCKLSVNKSYYKSQDINTFFEKML